MSAALADLLDREGINETQFHLMETSFMRDILSLSGGQIFEILSVQQKNLTSRETVETVSDEISDYVDIKKFSEYELKNMMGQLERYKQAVLAKVPHAELVRPSFMGAKKTTSKSKVSRDKSQQNSAGSSSANEDVFCRRSSRIQTPQAPDISFEESNEGSSSKASSSSGNAVKRQALQVLDLSEAELTEEEHDGVHIITKSDLDAAVAAFERGPEPQFASLKGNLPNFDVLKILREQMVSARGVMKSHFLELFKHKFMERTKRLCIIRTLTRYLYQVHVADPSEVTSQMKEGMAKSFCIVFPSFANTRDQSQPWSPLYNPKGPSGYIMNASRAFMRIIREKQDAGSKKKRKTAAESCVFDEDDVAALALINPGRAERTDILDGMSKCFFVREQEREKGQTIAYFLKRYPQFLNYEGEVLNEEFVRMKPKSEDGCKNFLKYQSKILALNLRRDTTLPIEDDTLKALLILSQHLPHDIPTRTDRKKGYSRTWAEIKDLVVVLKLAADVGKYVEDQINKSKTTIQPYLILVKGQVDTNRVLKTFLVLDGKVIEIKTVNTLKSIDWLFKSFYVFNVCFPLGWRNVLHCLQTCFYKFFEDVGTKKDAVTCSEFNLMKTLDKQTLTAPL